MTAFQLTKGKTDEVNLFDSTSELHLSHTHCIYICYYV
jgi:hypothetical protein